MVTKVDLFTAVAHDLMVGVNDAYNRLGIADRMPTIDVTHGQLVPHDECDHAWITLASTTSHPFGRPCLNVPLAVYRIEVVRCWPTPDDQGRVDFRAQREAAEGLQQDAAALWELAALNADGSLITIPAISCDNIRFLDMRPTGPAGGLAGWTFPIEVGVWGLAQGFG